MCVWSGLHNSLTVLSYSPRSVKNKKMVGAGNEGAGKMTPGAAPERRRREVVEWNGADADAGGADGVMSSRGALWDGTFNPGAHGAFVTLGDVLDAHPLDVVPLEIELGVRASHRHDALAERRIDGCQGR